MQADIQPDYKQLTVTCSCGNRFDTRSTHPQAQIKLEVCSICHPVYTGKQNRLDGGGQVSKFRARYMRPG